MLAADNAARSARNIKLTTFAHRLYVLPRTCAGFKGEAYCRCCCRLLLLLALALLLLLPAAAAASSAGAVAAFLFRAAAAAAAAPAAAACFESRPLSCSFILLWLMTHWTVCSTGKHKRPGGTIYE